MRAALIIIHIIVAYLLLKGWPASFPMWIRALLALIVITIGLPLRTPRDRSEKRSILTSIRKWHWMDLLYIGSVILIIELLLLSILTLIPKEAQAIAEDLHEFLKPAPSSELQDTPSSLSHNKEGNWLWDNHSQRPLAPRSNKTPKNNPDIYLDLLTPQATQLLKQSQIYVKSFALDHFDGFNWSIHKPTKYTISKGEKPTIIVDKLNHTIAEIHSLPIHRFRVTKTYHHDGQNVFCALQNALTTELSSLTKVNTDTFLLPPLGQEGITYNYIATSQPLLLDDILTQNPDIEAATTQTIDGVYLSKVTDYRLQQKITNFASIIPDDLSTAETLKRIRQLIRKQCRYSLKIQNPNKLQPLDNFLFNERVGYCEHFATASAMLCREHGIPSRIAYGWTGGNHFLNTNLFVFLAKHAHAWTEIYLDGYGWVIFDTTPAENIHGNQPSEDPSPDKNKQGYFFNMSDSSDLTPSEDSPSLWSSPLMLPIKILGIGALLTTLLLILRQWTAKSGAFSSYSHLPATPPRYLQLFETLSATLGHFCQSGSTLAQNIATLKQSPNIDPDTIGTLDKLLAYHYGITYRDSTPNKAKESELIKSLKSMIQQHTA